MDNILNNSRFGWVGLYRSIKEHWIYPVDVFTKYEAWIDLLLMVNYSEQKVFTGSDMHLCNIGETITSQQKLMNRWGWSKSKLIKFLKVLEKDSMIAYKSDSKKTSIIVNNYEQYQDFGGIDEIKKDHKKTVESLQKDFKKTIEELTKRLQKDTNNKGNTDKEEKKVNKSIPEFQEFKEHALSKEPNIDLKALENKYDSWVENDWKDGNDKKIKNWKSKLSNTITYIPKYEKQNLQTRQKEERFSNSRESFTKSEKSNIPTGNNKTTWSK